jgi:hypothetical protein
MLSVGAGRRHVISNRGAASQAGDVHLSALVTKSAGARVRQVLASWQPARALTHS